jgi:hypothetical protein
MKPHIAVKRSKANTIRVRINDGLVIDVSVSFVEIAGAVPAAFIGKPAGYDLHELRASMSVRRQPQAGSPLQKHDFGLGTSQDRDFAPSEARCEPPPRPDLATWQRSGKQSSKIGTPLRYDQFPVFERRRLKTLQRTREGIRRQMLGPHFFKELSTDRFKIRDPLLTQIARFKVHANHKRWSGTQRPRGTAQ